jgi:dihydrofolate synthase/folylpolyglutamate synthase
MTAITTIAGVEKILAGYVPPNRKFRTVYTLDTMQTLMAALGNPQDSYKVIHVAGTSGKTSTAYYATSLLMEAGLKVGLTVSPHVDQVSERIQINLQMLPEAQYCQEFEIFMLLVKELEIRPTYFELLVAFAYWEFARAGVDYAVVEVGLGGLLDGTNVITRTDKVSVITDIGLDHVDILGHNLKDIAAQKAGIILPDSDAFCLEQSPEAIDVFKDYAQKHKARLRVLSQEPATITSSLPLYQQRNWYLAQAAVAFVLQRDGLPKLTPQQLQHSTLVHIPARMEIIRRGDNIMVLDAAHNPQKMQALIPSLQKQFPGQKFAVLFALLRSKDMRLSGVLNELLPITSHLIVTDFIAGQDLRKHSTPPGEIVDACQQLGFDSVEIIADTKRAYQALKERPEKYRLVTGSFYLLHDMHTMIGNL